MTLNRDIGIWDELGIKREWELRRICDYPDSRKAEIIEYCSFITVSLLLKYKFDVFGLIEAGLAVSVHDVGGCYE